MIKSRRMKWARRVACMGENRKQDFVRKGEGSDSVNVLVTDFTE